MKQLITLLLMLLTLRSAAQEIAGRVVDNKKVEIINAAVQIYQGQVLKGASMTDFDGNYVVKPLEPGTYDVIVLFMGYDTVKVIGVVVAAGQRTTQNFCLSKPKSKQLAAVTVISYKRPLVDLDRPGSRIVTREEIHTMPTRQVTDVASTGSATYQYQRGAGVNLSSARTGTQYIVDGVVVRGAQGIDMAQGSVQQLSVITSGVPAKYGDPSGGAVNAVPEPNPVPQAAPPPTYFNPSEEAYKKVPENDFMNVKASPVSTMSVDVDRASYANVRRFITQGQKPPADAVRIEEMINYFNFEYPQPQDKAPIAIKTELTDCPWAEGHQLLHIGMQALRVNADSLPPSNLVFLIDVSGSMEEPDKLPLLIDGMKLLVVTLRSVDKVAIVTYAGNAGLVLPPTPGNEKQKILNALNSLRAGGSTAGGAGIMLAYKIAKDNFIKGGNNRVLLATDGDFNVGVTSDNELEDLITKQRETGIFLTCLGFGTGNFKDAKMEMLADKGNGNYDYIDNLQEANKTLVREFGGTLFTVAKDVKAQIEFNPAKVQGYRLIGYENRMLNTEDFKDDKKDAGDMGSGHTVTIIYEIIPAGKQSKDMRAADDLKYQAPAATDVAFAGELATIKFRYKEPDGKKSSEIAHVITDKSVALDSAAENAKFATAVAMFGLLLRDSKYKGSSIYDDVLALAEESIGLDKEEYRTEFIEMVKAAKKLDKKTARR